jgi:hypothetical protein
MRREQDSKAQLRALVGGDQLAPDGTTEQIEPSAVPVQSNGHKAKVLS